ncbi:unnamed protein product [Larinioides sclopetarius]|uniref:Reverse transcriptase n=1 Tax=Larinioides sclopetarius TaxID=280406 RepID=A0AAV1YYA2_9ARAC
MPKQPPTDQAFQAHPGIWKERKFPSSWREAVIIPILKPGKDAKSPNNYRPIALTSVLCKLLERMPSRPRSLLMPRDVTLNLFLRTPNVYTTNVSENRKSATIEAKEFTSLMT